MRVKEGQNDRREGLFGGHGFGFGVQETILLGSSSSIIFRNQPVYLPVINGF